MSERSAKLLNQLVSDAVVKKIDHWVAKYPAEEKQSAVMSALMLIQDEHGHLTDELMDAVAEYLEMPPIAVGLFAMAPQNFILLSFYLVLQEWDNTLKSIYIYSLKTPLKKTS